MLCEFVYESESGLVYLHVPECAVVVRLSVPSGLSIWGMDNLSRTLDLACRSHILIVSISYDFIRQLCSYSLFFTYVRMSHLSIFYVNFDVNAIEMVGMS